MSVLQLEEPNLLQNLRLAEQQQEWAMAQAILQPLGEMYQRTGRKLEFQSLRLRLLKQVGVNLTSAKLKGKEAFGFWIYLRNQEANETAQSGNFDEAKKIYQEILNELTALNNPSLSEQIAILDNLLGNIAWELRQFDKAITYYQKALHIFEAAGDEYNLNDIYLQLGTIAQEQQQLDEAIAYYQKAFLGYRKFQEGYKASITLVKWGNVLEVKEKWAEALQIYTEFVIGVWQERELIDLRIKAWSRILNHLGKSQFDKLWREVTGEDCPKELCSVIQAVSEENEE